MTLMLIKRSKKLNLIKKLIDFVSFELFMIEFEQIGSLFNMN